MYFLVENISVPQSDSLEKLILEMRDEIKSLKSEILNMKKEITELKDGNQRSFMKLTEEVIAVKLENRKHHDDNTLMEEFKDMQKLPFAVVDDIQKFEKEVEENEDKLKQYVSIIASHKYISNLIIHKSLKFSETIYC